MLKIYNFFFLFFFLSNCTSPSTALISPLITGVKTGSAYQASLSYSSNKIISELVKFKKTNNQVEPVIVSSFAVIQVKISAVEEPETMP
jgi:hypothetical protein